MSATRASRHWHSAAMSFGITSALLVVGCNNNRGNDTETGRAGDRLATERPELPQLTGQDIGLTPQLPPPDTAKVAAKFSSVVGWPADRKPTAPDGFTVTLFADSLENPRWLYLLPNGDVLAAEARTSAPKRLPPAIRQKLKDSGGFGPSANRISRLRDANGDGRAELRETFLDGLNQPFGMLALGRWFYVANTDGLLRFPYDSASATVTGRGRKILDLPAGGYNNHWTRNVIASPDGSKLYVTVGSGTNVDDEHVDRKDRRRAAILELNPDGTGMRVFASGLRNPNGLGWEPASGALWTAVNERDELGDELVPDYITSVRRDVFYGWPYSYWGQHPDPRRKNERPDLVAKAIAPDFAVGAHTATLGLLFGSPLDFPEHFRNGAFLGQHGSWNRSTFVGYRVAFAPFEGGRPTGKLEEFLTGFLADPSTGKAWGRPVGLAAGGDGSLLVADDAGNRIWRVAAKGAE
jgi:glucose/arabinose dehydrogenase